ncbi:insulin-induced protein-domain-containing protein [Truncatella angustata]|uniref:Insulin-induced protein-domain-containing protein n=1 Tax=Truncatella angustata TaxID=152316 RepID=A0A9P8ULB9_9PEZI|nr:insulin-induced protein-domain-containing protein [Truncatella angustata]KAH6654090.1 insulin-induced protein-domain-containing protein [Truncatella angustata]
MSQNQDGPTLLRPIPRRPFKLNFTGPTPPEEQDDPQPQVAAHSPDQSSSASWSESLNLDTLNRRLLDPRLHTPRNHDRLSDSGEISRAQSYLNLTSSALYGIYSPTTYGKDRFEQDEPDTPWGTGAETPAKKLSTDEPYYKIQKERGRPMRRRSSLHQPVRPPPLSRTATVLYMGLRALLLFGLGLLYGVVVASFQDRHNLTRLQIEDVRQSSKYDISFMAFWGVSGVVLGALLPWFDGVWEGVFGHEEEEESASDHAIGSEEEPSQATDWGLAFRGIGAFVGIVFAIRKTPWASTLQVSLALALVNPFLWYLIDRSKPGFLLSSTISVVGSAIVMSLRPDMVPTPACHPAAGVFGSNSSASTADPVLMLGGLASQQTVEKSIWMLSILFCCCVCFGNIGRRLAFNQSGSNKGRWAQQKTG